MTADQMIKTEIAKQQAPRKPRGPLFYVIAALIVAAVAAVAFFGLSAANAYRADIAAMESNAQELYDAAAEQRALADAAADRAEGFAQEAGESVSSLEAAEAEAAAIAEAEAAAAAASAAENPVYGQYPSGYKVPFIKNADPEDAAGGAYDTSACASKSASTDSAGVPRCD